MTRPARGSTGPPSLARGRVDHPADWINATGLGPAGWSGAEYWGLAALAGWTHHLIPAQTSQSAKETIIADCDVDIGAVVAAVAMIKSQPEGQPEPGLGTEEDQTAVDQLRTGREGRQVIEVQCSESPSGRDPVRQGR